MNREISNHNRILGVLFIIITLNINAVIAGHIIYQIINPIYSLVNSIDVPPPPAVSSDVSWPIYSNTQFGFSMKVLPELKHSESQENNASGSGMIKALEIKQLTMESFFQGTLTECCSYEGPNLNISIFPEQGNEKWVENDPGPSDALSDFTIAGITVKKLSSRLTGVHIGPLKHNGNVYKFDIYGYNKTEKDFETIYHMLSTFQFTALPKTSTSVTCIPRPACLNAHPRCLIAESENMCPY